MITENYINDHHNYIIYHYISCCTVIPYYYMVSFHQGSCDDQPLFSETGADQREESTHETHQGGGAGLKKRKNSGGMTYPLVT